MIDEALKLIGIINIHSLMNESLWEGRQQSLISLFTVAISGLNDTRVITNVLNYLNQTSIADPQFLRSLSKTKVNKQDRRGTDYCLTSDLIGWTFGHLDFYSETPIPSGEIQ